ncbi:MAG: class I SAM-dependent methyltransferase [Burkholderiales bacterium]|nr:class I SAM-dependent methyltransferase [Burkholderiales bacterium]
MPLLRAAVAQGIAWWAAGVVGAGALAPWPAALGQGAIAAAIGQGMRLPAWWIPLNVLLPVAVLGAGALGLAPGWYLGAFVTAAIVFWSTFRTRVPLFLSSDVACDALATLLQRHGRAGRFADLGAGTGTVLAKLAPRLRDWTLHGFEVAPGPWALARWRLRDQPNARVDRSDFWRASLRDFDIVYAFLSPVPMSALWCKVRDEMRAGTLFVSNSFAPADAPPPEVIPLVSADGSRPAGDVLFVWRL